jgi:hypothetical protein
MKKLHGNVAAMTSYACLKAQRDQILQPQKHQVKN